MRAIVALSIGLMVAGAVGCGDDGDSGGAGGEAGGGEGAGPANGGGPSTSSGVSANCTTFDVDCTAFCANVVTLCEADCYGSENDCTDLDQDCVANCELVKDQPVDNIPPESFAAYNCVAEEDSCDGYVSCYTACLSGN